MPEISKIKINESVYDISDKEVEKILNILFGNIESKDIIDEKENSSKENK